MNFIVSILISLVAVIILVLIPWIGVGAFNLKVLFGIIIPYAAILTFFIGIIRKVIIWAKSPVPYRIPTTAGQQWTHPWIKYSKIDNPKSNWGVTLRMLFEVLCFRSLFRNTKLQFREGPKIGYEWEKWLWLFALLFHYSFFVTVLRHMRFFMEPVPGFIKILEKLDSFLEVGIFPFAGFETPVLFLSGVVLPVAITLLFLRRLLIGQVRFVSLPSDYFPLFLILGIATTGILMRYFLKQDLINIKALTLGIVTFHPTVPDGIGVLFFIHLFLVCVLLAYIPFSKIMHMAGIFLSPTRNLSNNSRFKRHVNPWEYPVKLHSYEDYEEEFRDKMIEAGIPVEKMPEEQQSEEQEQKDES